MKANTMTVLLMMLMTMPWAFANETADIQDAIILSLDCHTNNTSLIEFLNQGQRVSIPIQDGFCARFKTKYGESKPCTLRHADLILLNDKNPHPEAGSIRVIGIINQRVERNSCI